MANMDGWVTVPFVEYRSSVRSRFWEQFLQIKLNQDMPEMTRRIWGYYYFSSIPGTLVLDKTAFDEYYEYQPGRQHIEGYHINYNTLEEFLQQDRSFILDLYGDFLVENIFTGLAIDEPYRLITFVLTSYTDVISKNFHYWFAFPSVSHGDYVHFFTPHAVERLFSPQQMRSLVNEHSKLESSQRCFFFLRIENADRVSLVTLRNFIDNKSLRKMYSEMADCLFLTYLDFTNTIESAGWLLRNALFLLKYHCSELAYRPLRVLSLRGLEPDEWEKNSVLFNVRQKAEPTDSMARRTNEQQDIPFLFQRYVGWESNQKGEQTYQRADINNSCVRSRLYDAEDNQLILKLANWNLDPVSNFDFVKEARYLILGTGAVGCSIARELMGWGALEITFVDDGRVSYYNPVRQSLFLLEDAKEYTYKAIAAANALKRINNRMISHGEVLKIPVPGRDRYIMDDVLTLESLICNHDVIFLATGTVESLWLPTLICALEEKVAIAVSMKYNSYFIIRHGTPLNYYNSVFKLGCYFCEENFLPTEYLDVQVEDEPSMIKRPGLNNTACAIAVELAIAVLQNKESENFEDVILEHIPHSIKGYFCLYNEATIASPANNHCIACSNAVLTEYKHKRIVFLQKVFADVKYLREISDVEPEESLSE